MNELSTLNPKNEVTVLRIIEQIKKSVGLEIYAETRNYSNKLTTISYDKTLGGKSAKCLVYFLGNSTKFKAYRFESEIKREKYIISLVSNIQDREESKKVYAAKKKQKQIEQINTLQIGDLFYNSWGYNTTRVSFYQVVGTKGKLSVILKPICGKIVSDSGNYGGNTVPEKDGFIGDEVVGRISSSGISLKGDYLSKTEENREHYFNHWD